MDAREAARVLLTALCITAVSALLSTPAAAAPLIRGAHFSCPASMQVCCADNDHAFGPLGTICTQEKVQGSSTTDGW